MKRSLLAATIASCLALTACGGGGGGNVKSDPVPATPVPPTPTTPTTPTTPAPTPTTPVPPPVAPRYRGEADNLLVPINADLAHKAGATGAGVKVGVMDDFLQPSYAPLAGDVAFNKDYTASPGTSESSANTHRGHGTVVSSLILGDTSGTFNGGVAPDATLHYARICAENSCGSQAARSAAEDMAAAGVRIVNLSLGNQYTEASQNANAAAAWKYALDPIVKAGGLVIAATGNEAQSTPDFPAASPTLEPTLRYNWLAVAAVELDASGKPTGLSTYSNACGNAAAFCVVAPGTYTAPILADSMYSGRVAGTSMATATVSGVAALVSSVYPWMTGTQLQETVLTTATDLGDAGVDARFGWGLVNAEKAVNGPAALLTGWTAAVSRDATFANDISGKGSLTKIGSGTLTLLGNNTYTGSTAVLEGTVSLHGALGSDVILGNDATFAAHGGRIDGNYEVVNTRATTAVQLGKPLQVTGKAALQGHLLLLPEAAGYSVGGTETLLSAGTLQGSFADVKYANGFFWNAALGYDARNVTATLTRASAQASARALSAPQAVIDGAGQADALVASLDQHVRNGDTAGLDSLLSTSAGLLAVDDARAAASLATLTGQVHGVQRTLAVTSALNDLRVAADRLPLLADTQAPTAWVQADYLDGDLDRAGYASARYRTSALTVGLDLPAGGAGTVLGVAVTGGRNRADIAAASSRLQADRIALTGYAWQPLGDGYLSGVLSYGRSDVDTVRTVIAGNAAERVSSARDEAVFSARIEAGITLANGLSPFVALGHVSHQQKAFRETSALGLGLAADADHVDTSFADIGLRLHQQRGAWRFDSVVAWRDVFSGRNTDFRAGFTGLQDARFTVAGEPVSAEALRASFGVGYQLSPTLMLHGSAGAERGASGADNVNANLGLRWVF